ncbi:MAG: energy-coupling factor ABC transporter ATP-binding protein [Desulfovibrio sp.]|jgi:cobalt/nickel transport system ATP-binding protein|nr:energy-coupling factor ABC transporter ATP-binding protein [Desulfovibrio sp.]
MTRRLSGVEASGHCSAQPAKHPGGQVAATGSAEQPEKPFGGQVAGRGAKQPEKLLGGQDAATGFAEPLFAVEDLRFTYRGKDTPLLNGADLRLERGERLGLTGKNGSGKSTLLHIGAGLIKADGGRVILAGRECASEKDFVVARRSLGYLLQNTDDMLFCSSILEDVAFGPCNTGLSEPEAERAAYAALARLGLEHLAERNGRNLSGGERKLAALACVLVMNVRLLFLDEPTNDLDDDAGERLVRALEECCLPALVVSHDLPFLRRVCTRFCLLQDGRIGDIPAA